MNRNIDRWWDRYYPPDWYLYPDIYPYPDDWHLDPDIPEIPEIPEITDDVIMDIYKLDARKIEGFTDYNDCKKLLFLFVFIMLIIGIIVIMLTHKSN